MLSKCKTVILFTLFLVTPLFSAVNTDELLSKYQDAIQLGKEQFYDVVQDETLEIMQLFHKESENSSTLTNSDALSILSASSYYYAYFSIQKIHYDTLNLYDQVEILRAVIENVNASILILKNYPDQIGNESISLLFYSRGLAKLYLANQLLNAIVWKQYIVQPTMDITNLVESAKKDFKLCTTQLGVGYDEISKSFLSDNLLLINQANIKKSKPFKLISNKMNEWVENPRNLKTFSLIVNSEDKANVSGLMSELVTNHIYKPIYFLNSNRVQNTLERSERFVTYEEITSKDNRPLFSIILRSVELSIPILP
jgi:hypothetical protein